MSGVWNTKFGPRRVRQDPPTVEEAVVAASGLTDDLQEQVEIAAALIGLPTEEVRGEVMRVGAQRKTATTVAVTQRTGGARSVVVERKVVRRPPAPRQSASNR